MSEPASESAQMRPRRIIVLVPLILFLGLTALFLVRLNAGDPSLIPSALIGHAVPQTSLPAIAGLKRDGVAVPGLDPESFEGAVTVVNLWASWCVPCRDEAPLLMQLAQDSRLRVVSINYKDDADNARRFSWSLRQSIRRHRRRSERPGRHRMGRVRRAGDFRHRPRCPYRLQARRSDHAREF